MRQLNLFELMCYIISALMLTDLIHKKDYDSLYAFGSAAIVGYIMELAAVKATNIYFYNPNFWLSVGAVPHQFPLFGGIMWGGLTVYALKLAQKLHFGKLLTALTAGMLIVTMDMFLDVAAIRLDGGFWIWEGIAINFDINFNAFMSVIWVNFLGYMVEVPAVSWLTLKKRERVKADDWRKQILYMFAVALGGIAVTAAGSSAALFLNSITKNIFACAAFVPLWLLMAVIIVRQAIRVRLRPVRHILEYIPVLIFWTAMYGYCILALLSLGLWAARPWYLISGFIFAMGTMYICVSEPAARIVGQR